MSGLPDEAVEAMARAARAARTERHMQMCAESQRVWGHPGAVTRVQPLTIEETVAAAFAALPAGVYVSDGKGKVMAVSGPFCSCAGAALAALSATDTDTHSQCDCGADKGTFFTAHPSGHAVTCATRRALSATDTEGET